jgi:hypothetical protein
LAKGEAGIKDRVRVPTLADFAPRFDAAIETLCGDKPATVDFYKKEMRRLLADGEPSAARLDAIDEALIDGYKQRRARQRLLRGEHNREFVLSHAVEPRYLTPAKPTRHRSWCHPSIISTTACGRL